MKLASFRDGSRDGRLLVVSTDLSRAVEAPSVFTMQQALDDWDVAQIGAIHLGIAHLRCPPSVK